MKKLSGRFLVGILIVCLLMNCSPFALAVDANETTALSIGDTFTNGGITYKVTGETTVAVVSNTSSDEQHSTYSGDITIPATVENDSTTYNVTEIAALAFEQSTVTKVTVPDSVTKIGMQAFYQCSTITEIVLNEGLLEIGQGAFKECTSLATLNLPDTVTDIGNSAFGGCSALTSLTIPAGVEDGMIGILIGSAVRPSSDAYPHLDSVTFASGSPYDIQDSVLYKDTVLEYLLDNTKESITVKDGTTEIADYALGSSAETSTESALTSVTLPSSVTKIGTGAFANTQITQIDLSNVTEIGAYAFSGCTELETVTWPTNLETLETDDGESQAFYRCEKLKDVVISGNIEEIPPFAFFGCLALESIELPEGLTKIGMAAFALVDEDDYENSDPKLEYINIPSTVTSLGAAFLGGVKPETALIFQGQQLPSFEEQDDMGALYFIDSSEAESPLITVYYPAGAAEAYTDGNSALLTAGLVTAPSEEGGEDQKEQGYALPESTSKSIVAENSVEIGVYTLPDDANLTVTSSDTSKATVANDEANKKITVTGVADGNVTITAEIKKGNITLAQETYTITVTAKPVSVTEITLSETSLSLREGKTTTLTATVMPEDATNKNVTWTSSNPDVVTVENGVVTAVSKGEATITVTTEDGSKTAACTVTVTKKSSGGGGGSSTPSYSVSAPSKVENGTVKVNPTKAEKGDTVTITVTPDKGYEVDEVVVTDKNGKEISVKDKGNGKYTFTMPASKVDIEVSFAEIDTTCDGGKDCPSYHFDDVNANDWYHEAVDYMVERGLMNGTSATTFEPNTTTTRAMLVSVLYRLENTPVVVGAANFNDVPAGQYYTDAVAWANANGIVTGYGNGNFGPNDTLTREQMAAIIYRYAAYKGYDVSARANLSGYTDAAQISGYAADAMAWINAEEIISGTSATTLSPAGNATRCQFAVILMRFCENVAK